MESLKGALSDLDVVPPPRHHRAGEMDTSLERLHRTGEVCLPTARAYGDHCAKVS